MSKNKKEHVSKPSLYHTQKLIESDTNFQRERIYVKRNRKEQNDTIERKRSKRKFTCTNCEQVFFSQKELQKHWNKEHKLNKELKCKDCDLICKTKDGLRKHWKHTHPQEYAALKKVISVD